MATIERKARVPYSVEQMVALVNDIDAYPEFLHWCHAARIETTDGDTVVAALEIGVSGIYKTIRTRNTTQTANEHGQSTIAIEMVEGPLKSLRGVWSFDSGLQGDCDVTLRLDYEVHLSPFGIILRTLFDEIANSQLNAFIKRAGAVYGEGND